MARWSAFVGKVGKALKGRSAMDGMILLGVLGLGLFAVAAVVVVQHWDGLLETEAASASLRNLFLVLVAIIGVPLAIWRSVVAKQQADASDRQAGTAERRLQNELYEKGAAMLGDETPSVRLGGIYSLKGLANDNPEYQDQVMELLCAFVRDPPTADGEAAGNGNRGGSRTGDRSAPNVLRDDVQTAIDIIARGRDETEKAWKGREGNGLDLWGARLNGVKADGSDFADARLDGATLERGRFRKATLARLRMSGGSMRGADFGGADVSGGRFSSVDMRGIHANDADFSRSDMNGVDLSGALASETRLSNGRISGSSLRKAMLQRAKLDRCQISNTDFSGADFWRADLSGTKFVTATRTTLGAAGATSETLYCTLTQAQLDKALAHPDFPPEFAAGTVDAETGQPLVWRGGCISDDQYPLIIGPQQVVKEGKTDRKVGGFLEWRDQGVRLVPGLVARLKSADPSGARRKAREVLEKTTRTDCARVTLLGRSDSQVDSCGVTRWANESRIWILFVFREESLEDAPESEFALYERNGPDAEAAWERWLDAVDWGASPIVETFPARTGDARVPPHRRAAG